MTIEEILALPMSWMRIHAIEAYTHLVHKKGPGQCPKCNEERQIQIINALHKAGPWWKCRKCKEEFHTQAPTV